MPFRGLRGKNGKITGPFRVYRASRTVCWACPAYGVCTKDAHTGRALWIGPHDELLRQHRRLSHKPPYQAEVRALNW